MKRQTRLAIVTTHPIQYNAPLFAYMQAQGVNFTIRVFYTSGQSKEPVFDREFGIPVKWDIPLLEGYDFTFVENTSAQPGTGHFRGVVNPALNNEIEAWNPDALLVYGWSFESHLKAIRHFYQRIPVLFRGDSTLIDETSGYHFKKLLRRLFLKWVYCHIDYALHVGSANKQYFLAHGLIEKQMLFAPHAVDNERFSNGENEYTTAAKKWRQDLGIESGVIIFLYAAKLTQKKDPELLIKSFLALQHNKAWLIMIGNGELETGLKEKYGSNSHIIFIDFQNQSRMPVVYRVADVFVLPSKGPGETWGLAVNEAMACGRAVIVSDKCGCSLDLVKNGDNGYVFENGNQENLTNVMRLAAERFAQQGRRSEQIIKNWSYAKTVAQLNELFAKEKFR